VIEQTNHQANLRALRPQVAGRDRELAAIVDGWSNDGHGTLPRRLAHALRRAIRAGVLPTGYRLPPERQLAGMLAVSRATVTDALDELRAEGLVASQQGRGTFVSSPAVHPAFGTRLADHLVSRRGIDLATGNPPDVSHLPNVEIDMSHLLAAGDGPGVEVTGLPAMREAVADLFRRGGVTGAAQHTDLEQIHITSGAHQAVSLLVGTLVGRGRSMALADVNYPGAFDILDGHEAVAAPVRTDRAGMLPESLEQVIREQRPAALYVQSGPHNPTGHIVPPSRLRALGELCDRHGIPVIEDHTLEPLCYDASRPLTTFASTCRTADVTGVWSMSKVCWAGLRLGWIRASEPLVTETMHRRLSVDLGASAPSQLLALALLPHLDDIAAERRRRLTAAVGVGIEALAEAIPEAVVEQPEGGSVLWTRLPIDDSGPFVHLARRHGVQVAPGSICVPGRVPGPWLRICVDRPIDLVVEGMARLGRAWRDREASPLRVVG
jgi:DNA-binding transcriptional MocR family regulator